MSVQHADPARKQALDKLAADLLVFLARQRRKNPALGTYEIVMVLSTGVAAYLCAHSETMPEAIDNLRKMFPYFEQSVRVNFGPVYEQLHAREQC